MSTEPLGEFINNWVFSGLPPCIGHFYWRNLLINISLLFILLVKFSTTNWCVPLGRRPSDQIGDTPRFVNISDRSESRSKFNLASDRDRQDDPRRQIWSSTEKLVGPLRELNLALQDILDYKVGLLQLIDRLLTWLSVCLCVRETETLRFQVLSTAGWWSWFP